ncbi:hypothetical protein LPUS_02489 [Lasallia pustulata]|uniref:Gag polymerase env n=1 Tax=Lasallia pustulata TaxID=136370 RepID=A0A1W5CTA6_9LECA|nr:hypothetical protein LPUS_02489 [Lasallia pustulata]
MRRQLKWVKKLAEYDFNVIYREGKKNPANGLLGRPDYELPKASTTSTAAEMVRQSFCLGSKDYKSVQEKLYTLAAMTLRPRHIGMEDSGAATVEESSVRRIPAREASRNGDGVVQQDNVVPHIHMDVGIDGSTTGRPVVCNLHTQEASRDGYASTTYTEAGRMTGTSAVCNIHAQEASRDGYASTTYTEAGGTTGTPAAWYPEAQHRSIKDSAADAEAMDIDNTVDEIPLASKLKQAYLTKRLKHFGLSLLVHQ